MNSRRLFLNPVVKEQICSYLDVKDLRNFRDSLDLASLKCPVHLFDNGKHVIFPIINNIVLQLIDTIKNQGIAWTLHQAITDNELDKVILLLEGSVDPNSKSIFSYPIYVASGYGFNKIVELLIKYGADVDKIQQNKETALMFAAQTDKPEILKILIAAGANIERTGYYGDTALLNTIRRNNISCFQVLIEAGANIHTRNYSGKTALILAAAAGSEQIVKTLIELGAKIDEVDQRRMTALMEAADNGHRNVFNLLLEAGANRELRNIWGKTADQMAKQQNEHGLRQ